MRIIGLLAVTFLIMLLAGRILGRDALLAISIASNLILIGMRLHTYLTAKIAAAQREDNGR
jgi:hypothetical protein